MISVDSYGWIERFTNGPKAVAVQSHHRWRRSTSEIITSVVTLYEVYRKVKKAKDEETALEAVAALSQTKIVDIDQTLSLEAADHSLEHGLHMADSLIYATAQHHDAELYTSDKDLKGLKGVTFV